MGIKQWRIFWRNIQGILSMATRIVSSNKCIGVGKPEE